MSEPTCPHGHPMRRLSHFRFDHESTDSPHETAVLRHLQTLGVELGASVTLWYCPPCDFAEARFAYERENP